MENVLVKKIRYKLKNLFRRHLLRPFVKKRSYDMSNNHYIFADPRGGSTWLMEIIQNITNEPVIWEPLDLKLKNNPFNSIDFDWRQHIPSDENWPEAKMLFSLLFQGKILEKNILDYSTLKQLNNSYSLLFKICRGNALLPWLTENFEFNFKPIHMIRHPFAVASSQIKHGGWNHLNSKFEIPDTPFNIHYKKHEAFLKALSTKEEILVAKWCLSNLATLNHTNNNKKWISITYEDFVLNPNQQIKRILKSWNIKHDLSNIDFESESQTTYEGSPSSNLDKIKSWQDKFDNNQIESMGKILEYFNCKIYSKDTPMANLSF